MTELGCPNQRAEGTYGRGEVTKLRSGREITNIRRIFKKGLQKKNVKVHWANISYLCQLKRYSKNYHKTVVLHPDVF